MKNYFQGHSQHPQHVSVGAIVLNDKSEICCHHFAKKTNLKGYWQDQGVEEFYILMRETLDPEDSLEKALNKGLLEEFGIEAELVDYIGSIRSYFKNKGSDVQIQKTTLYFLCKLKNQDLDKRSGDIESKSQVEWHTADFLIPKMKEQARKYGRTDIDESEILEKIKTKI